MPLIGEWANTAFAFKTDQASGHRTSLLKAIYVPDFRDARSTYRVDLEKRALVRILRSTRIK